LGTETIHHDTILTLSSSHVSNHESKVEGQICPCKTKNQGPYSSQILRKYLDPQHAKKLTVFKVVAFPSSTLTKAEAFTWRQSSSSSSGSTCPFWLIEIVSSFYQ
jgi:hypothetical protein